MSFDPEAKMCPGGAIEKGVLRKAFTGFLPKEILWRQKEQFSDGVGYSWIDELKKHVEAELAGDLDTTMATMTDDPHLHNVPTMIGGVGYDGVRNFYRDHLVGKFCRLLEPLIMLVLGVLIGGLTIGLYLPIFKLGNTL